METRQITEVKIWGLILNPMKGNTEDSVIVAMAYEKQKLIDWHNSLFAPEPYKDTAPNSFPKKGDFDGYSDNAQVFHKVFIKGSELEWCNPCENFDSPDHHGHGLISQWIKEGNMDPNILFIN